MRGFWRRVSLLGLSDRVSKPVRHDIIILNQANVIILLIASMLLLLDFIESMLFKNGLGIGALRLLLIVILCTIHILFNNYKKFQITKVSLVLFLPLLLIIFPFLFGPVIDEYYLWFPYIPVTLSILPHFIFSYTRERFYLILTLSFYLCLVFFIDRIMIYFSNIELAIIPIINGNYFYYKLIPVASFIFVNVLAFYLLLENRKHEASLQVANKNIEYKRKQLRRNNVELNARQEELILKNEELEKILKKLKETQEQLVKSEKMATIGTLTAGIAHDIVNPFNFIFGGLQLLQNEIDDLMANKSEYKTDLQEKLTEMEEIIEDSLVGVDRVTSIISSLLTFSYEGRSTATQNEIHTIIDSALLIIKSKLKGGIKVIKKYNNVPLVECHDGKIYQVVLNIIDNAIYAINSKKILDNEEIVIQTSLKSFENQEFVNVSISNTGPPIPDEIMKELFTPFYTTKKKGEGTGLGLSICHKIIEEHQGKLTVRNEDSKVIFDIMLPVQ